MKLWLLGIEARPGSGYLDKRFGVRAFLEEGDAHAAAKASLLQRPEDGFLVLEAEARFAGSYRFADGAAEVGRG